jgi:hypothetical protein
MVGAPSRGGAVTTMLIAGSRASFKVCHLDVPLDFVDPQVQSCYHSG